MGKKTENLEIPPKNSKTQNSRENTEILADETMKEKEDKKLEKVRKSLETSLSESVTSVKTWSGRTSRSGRSLRETKPAEGSIPQSIAKFITKTNSKSPKQSAKTRPSDNEQKQVKLEPAAEITTNLDNKENQVVPETVPIEVKQELIQAEHEIPNCVVQIKLEDRTESFSKSSSEDPHCSSDNEKNSRDFSDTDSALGSTSSFRVDQSNSPTSTDKRRWQVGSVVWGSFNRVNWFPCMVYPYEDGSFTVAKPSKQTFIHVKYFNYNGMTAELPIKNLFDFGSVEAFNDHMREINMKKSKMKPFTQTCYRAMEEAKFFLEQPIESRKDLLDEVVALNKPKQQRKSDVKVEERKKSVDSAMDITSPAPMSPNAELKSDPIQLYIEKMQKYDELVSIEVKRERKSSVIKTEPIEVKLETVKQEDSSNRRKSGRAVKKRTFDDFIGQDEIKREPVEVSQAKKPKVVKTQSLEERFTVSQNDLRAVIKSTNKKRVCLECVEITNKQTYRCNGTGQLKCSGWFHEDCAGSFEQKTEEVRHVTGDSDEFIQVNTKTTLVCKNCENNNKSCICCNEEVSMIDKREFFQCPNQECRLVFHQRCFKLWPQTNGFSSKKQVFCPQHTCHTCFYKEEHKTGALLKCIKCPAAYHTSTNCLPAGTKIFSQTQCLCPRHPTEKEVKASKDMKPLNTDWCHMCLTSGNLVCCDFCPSAFHPDCIKYVESDEKFMCRECQEGRLPLYNTIVWTKVGAYRWWPGLILPEALAVGAPKHEREFCIKFFGSNDHHWTTCERCYNYEGSTFLQKKGSSSRLDHYFNIALDEAETWSEKLKNQELNATNSKPKPYTKILTNRPIHPVKLRKGDDSLQACNCKEDDENPCGPTSNCTNMHLNYECSPDTCPAGAKCQNQKLRNREYAEMKIVKTHTRGFGALSVNDLAENTFVIEYVGELIDTAEQTRRIEVKMNNKEKDFYILGVDRDLYVDAEPAGNLARFINHSCDPNCDTRKITVDGNTRIGIFTNKPIKANTELTFDYKMEFVGGKKSSCYCGAEKCSGMIGEKPKEMEKKPSNVPKKPKKRVRRSRSIRDSTSSAASSFTSSTPAPKRRRLSGTVDPLFNMLEDMLDDPSVKDNAQASL